MPVFSVHCEIAAICVDVGMRTCQKAVVLDRQGGESEPIPVRPVKATGYEMLGTYLREVSALILVFAPLDKLITEGFVPASWWGATFLCSSLLFLVGMALEHLNE